MSDIFDFSQFNRLKEKINDCIIRANNATPAENPARYYVNRNVWDADVVKKIIRHFEKNGFKVTTEPTDKEDIYILCFGWED